MNHRNPVVRLLRFDPVVEVREGIREAHVGDTREVHVEDIQEAQEEDIQEVQRLDIREVRGDIREVPDGNREVREEGRNQVPNGIPEVRDGNQEVLEDNREVLGDNQEVREDSREVRDDNPEVHGRLEKCLKEIIVLQGKDLLTIVRSAVKPHLDLIQGQIPGHGVKPRPQSADEQNHLCQLSKSDLLQFHHGVTETDQIDHQSMREINRSVVKGMQ